MDINNKRITEIFLKQIANVKILLLDVDGVLTDGGVYFDAQGEAIKRFNTLDGHGVKMLLRAGLQVAVISGRDSAALRVRLQALGVSHMVLGTEEKLAVAEQLLEKLNLNWSHVAVMGDDWPDLALMKRACVAFAPPCAHEENLRLAHHVSSAAAGFGAVREVCDILLKARGVYDRILESYLV